MGKKAKAHRAKVARRNRKIEEDEISVLEEYVDTLNKIKLSVWETVEKYGFSNIDEAWEKAPWIFLEVFPGEEPETIYNGLQLEWMRS